MEFRSGKRRNGSVYRYPIRGAGAGRRSGAKFAGPKSMFYEPPVHPAYADIVKMDSPENARKSANTLLDKFNEAKHRDTKVLIKKVTVLAANRAEASSKREKLSTKERQELKRISRIYGNAAERMVVD